MYVPKKLSVHYTPIFMVQSTSMPARFNHVQNYAYPSTTAQHVLHVIYTHMPHPTTHVACCTRIRTVTTYIHTYQHTNQYPLQKQRTRFTFSASLATLTQYSAHSNNLQHHLVQYSSVDIVLVCSRPNLSYKRSKPPTIPAQLGSYSRSLCNSLKPMLLSDPAQ